ncbi:LPS export ABC transporter permease LptG [Aquabacterium lacunae]|uniref:LPS export ABC transporter permease LptG n=1 Tax=Aquabacterium lacunae TaxID=2528630 RepID=A0A4Q9H5M9_9BURK|nr:LPS export ABC transporter permease LptG [Aquabacterium lacunae]TBO34060.1 LPS export ABC transporter permease LptG [Aquabacterium lacunae]
MKTVRKLLYGQILGAVLFVTLAFLALFLFFDLVDELQRLGRDGYRLPDALLSCAYQLPGHLYDIFPITLLIGSISALARLAQTSEYTILRTGGLGPGRALRLLGLLGLLAAALTFAMGEWAAPWGEQQLARHKARFDGRAEVTLGRGGAWLRDASDASGQGHTLTVNVGAARGAQEFLAVRVFEFNREGRLVRRLSAQSARIEPLGEQASRWHLQGVEQTLWHHATKAREDTVGDVLAHTRKLDTLVWDSRLSGDVVAASVLPIDTMSTAALWQYTRHLARNAQAVQKYELQFWKKTFAPLACLVMMSLALPFAYLQARSGGMSLKIFGGIMLGISFVLANHVSSHLGLIHQWSPWLSALAPSLFYTLMALSAFVWLVRNR